MSDGKIIYDVEVNDDGVESKVKSTNDKIDSAAQTGSSAFSEVWTGALRAIGGKLVELGQQAVQAAVDVGKEALAQTASFEQLEGGVKKLFDTSAGVVMENAKKAFSTAGMSANEYMENVTGFSASLITSLGGNTKKAAELADIAIRDMSDNANTFGTDMGSITNTYQGLAKQNYSMLDNLKLGFAGTKEGMTQLIKEASAYAKEHKELGITVEEGNLNFANCVEAIHVMQEKMKIAGTTSAEAAGTIEGSVNSMKAAWQNFLTGTMSGEEFAETALVAADNVVNALMDIIPRLIKGFGEMTPTLIQKAGQIIDKLIQSMNDSFPKMMSKGGEILGKLADGLVKGIPDFVEKGMQSILKFSESLSGDGGKQMIDGGLKLIVSLITGLANAIPKLVEYVPQIILNLVNTIVSNLPSVIQAGVDVIFAIIKGIANSVPQLIAQIPTIIRSIVNLWTGTNWLALGSNMIVAILNGIANLAQNIPDYLRRVGNVAVNAFKSINWFNLGANIIQGIINGISENVGAIASAAKNAAIAALDAAKDFLGISSPSKEFAKIGMFSDQGEAEGMIENADVVEQASKEVARRALDAQMDVNYDLPDIDSASKDMSANLSGSLTSTIQRIIEVPLSIDAREIARATAWDMGEQLAWEMR